MVWGLVENMMFFLWPSCQGGYRRTFVEVTFNTATTNRSVWYFVDFLDAKTVTALDLGIEAMLPVQLLSRLIHGTIEP